MGTQSTFITRIARCQPDIFIIKDDDMNTERLHSVLVAAALDNEKLDLVTLLQNVETTYTQSVQSPNPQQAEAFNNAMEALRVASEQSVCAHLTPSRRKILESIGGGFLAGLIQRVEKALDVSRTPAEVVVELQKLRSSLGELVKSAQSVRSIFGKLNIAVEDTPSDLAEVEILLPKALVDSNLLGLAREARSLDRALSDIQETATGSRKSVELRSLGSGSVDFYMVVDPIAGAAILTLVTSIVQLINAILQTRKNQYELQQQEAPEAVIKQLRDWEKERINNKLENIRDVLLEGYPGDKGRRNELRTALTSSLQLLANRIDRGMDIDVAIGRDVSEVPAEPEAGQEEAPARTNAIEAIRNSSNIIQTLDRSAQPVLELPSASDEEQEEEKQSKDGRKKK